MSRNTAQSLADDKYRRKLSSNGYTRASIWLSPDETASLGRIMKAEGLTREQAIRRAIAELALRANPPRPRP